MIAANMNTTPTLVFDYDNPKLKKRKKVKIMCENYCLDLDSIPKVLQTLDGVTLCGLSYRRPENKPTAKHARIWANVGALSPLIKTR